jgi:hypothetical protein
MPDVHWGVGAGQRDSDERRHHPCRGGRRHRLRNDGCSDQPQRTRSSRNCCPTKALSVTSNPSLGVGHVGVFLSLRCAEKVSFLHCRATN